jgi:hypothetical protein
MASGATAVAGRSVQIAKRSRDKDIAMQQPFKGFLFPLFRVGVASAREA